MLGEFADDEIDQTKEFAVALLSVDARDEEINFKTAFCSPSPCFDSFERNSQLSPRALRVSLLTSSPMPSSW